MPPMAIPTSATASAGASLLQNYGMSIAVNGAGLVVGAAGPLSPVLAAVRHNASSVAVAVDSARLIRYEGTVAPDGSGPRPDGGGDGARLR